MIPNIRHTPSEKSDAANGRPATRWVHPLAPMLPALALAFRSAAATGVVALLRTPVSMRYFIWGWLMTAAAIWTFVAVYLLTAKPSYTSRWSLILPTASTGVSLQLESIGHAQTIPSSPFGSASLSPKVIYKEIMSSEQVLHAAAKSLGIELEAFGGVRVKLIDETSLMLLEISGPTADLAKRKADAVMVAFNQQLDSLRRDEIQRRADVVNDSLKSYHNSVQNARNTILEQQQTTGVLSINQFNESSTTLELMKRKRTELETEIARLMSEKESLANQLGMQPESAAAALRLSADPAFTKIAADYADNLAKFGQDSALMGKANPLLALDRERLSSSAVDLGALARAAGTTPDFAVHFAPLVMNGTHRSDLVKALVASEASLEGKRRELTTTKTAFQQASIEVYQMSKAVARLEDLKKDHLLAEAVFTSALARLDTNKVDIYASYPMVQTLAAPDRPNRRSGPSKIIALLFGVTASALALAAWGMAWLRQIFVPKR